MANIASAKKRARQAEKHRLPNVALRSKMRTSIKQVRLAIERKDTETARQAFREAMSVIDKVASKGVIHKNAAARYKHRLNERVKALVRGGVGGATPAAT